MSSEPEIEPDETESESQKNERLDRILNFLFTYFP